MKADDGKNYIAVPVECGHFVPLEVPEGVTKDEAIAEFRKGQLRMLVVALALALPLLLVVLSWR